MLTQRLAKNKESWPFFLIIIAGLGLRAYSLFRPGHFYDIGTFESWAVHLLRTGPANFYQTTWSDYLPLPIYLLSLIYSFSSLIGAKFELIFKLVSTIAELGLIYWATSLVRAKNRVLILALLLLSPALIGDTSYWGQIDTIPALLTVASLLLLKNTRKIILPSLIFGLAVALKPIVLLAAPLLWYLSGAKHRIWQFPLISALIFFATGVPAAGLRAPALLWERAVEQASTYPYTSVNGFNIYSLAHNFSSWVPDDRIILGVTPHQFGLTLFIFLSLNVLRLWSKAGRKKESIARVIATIFILFFTFTTRMHERHLMFGLPALALATLVDRALLVPYLILTASFTLNLWGAYHWVNNGQVWPFSDSFIYLASWATTVVAIALATVWNWQKFFNRMIQTVRKNLALVLILILGLVLRTVNLAHPPVFIFDEVYHAFTAGEYLHNNKAAWEWWTTPPPDVAYEWTHPPVAKYGMVAGMLAFGENSLGWRIGSALFGVLSILGFYHLVFALFKSKNVALLTALFLSVEGLHIAQSRIGMNDIYMLCFVVWSLYFAVIRKYKLSSVLFGLALASKWSTLYALAPLSLIYLKNELPHIKPLTIIRSLLIAAVVYVLAFTPFITSGHTWAQFVELHRQMWYYHTGLVATHGYQSTPIDWVLVKRPVWYWVQYAQGSLASIYAQGNPLILWLGLAAAVAQLKKIKNFPFVLLIVSYLSFTLPWVFSPRIMFAYHYLPSASFLTALLALWISGQSKKMKIWAISLCLISFVLISPMLYGYHAPLSYWDQLFKIFPSWK